MDDSSTNMNKRERQEEYVRRHAAHIISFAKTEYAECGRGVILIGWPSQDPGPITDEFVYLPEDSVKRKLKQIQPSHEETLVDRIIQVLQEYDPTWQATIVFLDHQEKSADCHVAGFLPHYPVEHLFICSSPTATNH